MTPWWLALGSPSLAVWSPYGRLRRILQTETRWEQLAKEEGERTWASEHHDQRKQAIHSFLADPGYCDADTIRSVRQLAPDLFGERQCAHYLTHRWPLHLDVLGRETLLHALSIASPLASIVFLKLGFVTAGLICFGIWILLLTLEYAWAAVAGILRQLLMTPDWPELDTSMVVRYFIASLPWWQKPAGWLFVPLAFPAVLRWRRRMTAAHQGL
ncbi:MAG: hypothetical protein ACRDHX_14010 [Chloroflexota bacterium]